MTYLTLVEDEEGKAERRIDRLGKNMKFTYPKAGVIEYYIYGKKSRSYDKYTAVDLNKKENRDKLIYSPVNYLEEPYNWGFAK